MNLGILNIKNKKQNLITKDEEYKRIKNMVG